MAINFFIISIVFISIVLTNINIEYKTIKTKYKNVPLVTFENSTMYDIDDKEIIKIVQARQALNYKKREELYDATIIMRNSNNSSDSISAEYIIKKDTLYQLYQSVNIIQGASTQLTTDYLLYDVKNKIAQNNVDFVLSYNDSELIGDNLYFDAINEIIRANNTYFKIRKK